MKTLITGTKYPHNIEYLLDRYNITHIITGNKKGVEQSVTEYAQNKNIPLTQYDNLEEALKEAEALILLYPNKSTLTKTQNFKAFKLIIYKPE